MGFHTPGITEEEMDEKLEEERKRTRRWQIVSVVLGGLSVLLGAITLI